MKTGIIAGISFSLAGIIAGMYFGVFPVLELLSSSEISAHQAGIYFATIGTVIGLSCAAIGIISNRATGNT